WKRVATARSLKRNTSASACGHPDINNHTQVSLRRTITTHGVIDDRCSRCRGPLEILPADVAAGGWRWRMQFNEAANAWKVLCGTSPGNCA
ncbi:MAG: hypothetical protein Q8S13_06415, partial [Dehalococcoidia bacterium]|nr:hypothetical protein [Dehalococcoidia bacterium]